MGHHFVAGSTNASRGKALAPALLKPAGCFRRRRAVASLERRVSLVSCCAPGRLRRWSPLRAHRWALD